MDALRIGGYEATPVHTQIPVPEVGPDEVLVRINAAGINPLDVKLQSGHVKQFFPLSFPYTMGTDFAGTVERVGTLAARWKPGDKVVARLDPTRGGALAEFAALPATYLAAAPARISLAQAAGAPTSAATAFQALIETARLRKGQTVLVHGGAGGVGSFAIQLARLMQARVIATATGPGLEVVRRLGADQAIDFKSEDFTATLSDVDVVLDPIGGETQQRSFQVLRTGGMLVSLISPPEEALAKAYRVNTAFVFHQSDASRLGVILGLLEAGLLQVLVDRTVSLKDAAAALERQRSGDACGKIIVSID